MPRPGPWRAGPGPTPACSQMNPWPHANANQCGLATQGWVSHQLVSAGSLSLTPPTPTVGLTRSGTPCTGLEAPHLALRMLTGLLDTWDGVDTVPFLAS